MTAGMVRNDRSRFVIARSVATWQSTPTPVIARSKATWQSIFQTVQNSRWIASPSARNDHSLLSLRGVKRRGNPYFRRCRTKDGLLRLRLAMTVGRIAMTPIYVIARSKATWQSIFQVVQNSRWIASPSARNDGGDGSQ
ncbi:MAG: hypothetical protein GW908_11965 [Thiomicrospira sp.]|nr:hypothetical protein [Thiomicrospira sp.]